MRNSLWCRLNTASAFVCRHRGKLPNTLVQSFVSACDLNQVPPESKPKLYLSSSPSLLAVFVNDV